MSAHTFYRLAVPDVLKEDVACFFLNEFRGEDETTINTFPNGAPGIVFHHNHGHPAIESITMQSGLKFTPPALFLYGPGTQSSVMKFGKGTYTVLQVILKPHALKGLFGLNALTLKEEALALNELASEDINDQLMSAHNDKDRVAMLIRFLIAARNVKKTGDTLIEESLRLIHNRAGMITIKALLEELNLSERQFERRFGQTVGISPWAYIRVRRFNEAIRLMKTRQYGRLTDIAYALNFHDQSHFIREIKLFTGITPMSLSQKMDDFSHNQSGYSYV